MLVPTKCWCVHRETRRVHQKTSFCSSVSHHDRRQSRRCAKPGSAAAMSVSAVARDLYNTQRLWASSTQQRTVAGEMAAQTQITACSSSSSDLFSASRHLTPLIRTKLLGPALGSSLVYFGLASNHRACPAAALPSLRALSANPVRTPCECECGAS